LIPPAFVTEWREQAPWPSDEQVEQDLILTRVLVDLFGRPDLRQSLAFRGGTALAKLYLQPAHRYSEDIDLVQVRPEPIGPTLDAMREVLDPWLGTPSWQRSHARVKLNYRVGLGRDSASRRKVKLEINTREHEPVYGLKERTFSVESRWFTGSAQVTTYGLDELLATKLRALYQRKKGRDLFDLATTTKLAKVDPQRVVDAFVRYLEGEGRRVSRLEFETNLAGKLLDSDFLADVLSLVADGTAFDAADAADLVRETFISRIL